MLALGSKFELVYIKFENSTCSPIPYHLHLLWTTTLVLASATRTVAKKKHPKSPDYETSVDLWADTIAMVWPFPHIPRVSFCGGVGRQ